MQLNLPIMEKLARSKRILIAGAGGGFDVFAGLPLYFTLRDAGKEVHLANYSFTALPLAQLIDKPDILIETLLVGARGHLKEAVNYYPEGYLARWFREKRRETVPIWMMARQGVIPLRTCYETLVTNFKIDTVILVDGGVDSLMRGNEAHPGSILEDSVSLAAISRLDVPLKILATIGFGAEVEENLSGYHALENLAALMGQGACYGSCSLVPQMPAFQYYEQACRYVWEQPNHSKSHISTRIIPAVRGQFGDYHMYPDDHNTPVFISPLMALYWFFDAEVVASRNLLIPHIRDSLTFEDVLTAFTGYLAQVSSLRPAAGIPY